VQGLFFSERCMTLIFQHIEPQASPLGRWDARWKIAALVPAALSVALLQTLTCQLLAVAGAALLVFAGRLPLRWYLVRIATLALLVALFVVWLPLLQDGGDVWQIGPLALSQEGARRAALILLKALSVMTIMMVVWATAPVDVTLKAAQALRVPGLLIQLLVLTYRYVFLLAEELGRLRIALRVRGYRHGANLRSYRTVGHVAGTLLVRSYERAERVSHAMRCRGFDGRFRSLVEFHTRGQDVLAFLIISVCTAGILGWDLVCR
jgi:cobalt/nickel transport system permease protein